MLLPASGVAYEDYVSARASLALQPPQVSCFTNPLDDGRQLGLHNKMDGLFSLYGSGKAAFIANVGTLVEPTTVAAIQAGATKLPLGLFSHSDQQLQWQSALPETRSPDSGWGGRLADCLAPLNGQSGVSMNLSLAGSNIFQSSSGTAIFSKRVEAVPGIRGWADPIDVSRRQGIESVLGAEYKKLFKQAFAIRTNEAIAASEEFRSALKASPAVTSPFDSGNSISHQLKDLLKTILSRDGLSKKRQTFFVKIGGWDMHGSLEPHGQMLQQLSEAVSEFQTAIEDLGLQNQVTLFSASDFGRTLTDNGGGSDHAWGGNQFVVGGPVNGRQVYSDYPDLSLGNPLDTGRGRLVPTLSVDEYLAELALWMGVSPTNLPLILPQIGRFYDTTSESPPVGFMRTSQGGRGGMRYPTTSDYACRCS